MVSKCWHAVVYCKHGTGSVFVLKWCAFPSLVLVATCIQRRYSCKFLLMPYLLSYKKSSFCAFLVVWIFSALDHRKSGECCCTSSQL